MNLAPILAAAALCLAPGQHAPAVHRFELHEGGLWEQWTVDVPQHPGPLSRVTIDLEARIRSTSIRYENLWLGWPPLGHEPFGALVADVPFLVEIAYGPLIHEERVYLEQRTQRVAPSWDGTTDFAGPSGTRTVSAERWSDGLPSDVDPAPFEGSGTVRLIVTAPADGVSMLSSSPAWASSIDVRGGGWLVVRLER